ncbi:MAG: class II fructose-bisphosphate aldolase, partial [Spirochaetales bacterium]|nr:class II fructose-bisphosphate aldolase [Spirochaetales bacterium]
MNPSKVILDHAYNNGVLVPSLNIPHLPMMPAVVQACVDEQSMAFIAVSRVEWEKFEAGSVADLKRAYDGAVTDADTRSFVRLHLDHVPVIDEDNLRVDYRSIISEAIDLGYDSVMVDGSRLSLDENIRVAAEIVELAHASGVPVEAELGAVFGHEDGPPPPYEEVFREKRGFTVPDEAGRFVRESGCDWLSVAFGSVHGAISEAFRDMKKPDARLDLDHLSLLVEATGIPLVLHGGSGVLKEYLLPAFKQGVAKMNIGTEIRQAYT